MIWLIAYALVGAGLGWWIGRWVFRDLRKHDRAALGVAIGLGFVAGLFWPITLTLLPEALD